MAAKKATKSKTTTKTKASKPAKKVAKNSSKEKKKNLSFVEATIKLINDSEETYEDIAYNIGCNAGTVRRIAIRLTERYDANIVQSIYEYLTECELEF